VFLDTVHPWAILFAPHLLDLSPLGGSVVAHLVRRSTATRRRGPRP
jgi:hypothetical protein